MEVNKLLKRKEKAREEKKLEMLAEVSCKLGSYYMQDERRKYDEAIREFQEASEIYRNLQMRIEEARANRMIGEVLVNQGKFKDALKYENIYLKIASEEKNLVEMQRAYATLGRCYLLKAEEENTVNHNNEDDENISNNEHFKAGERAFIKALLICKELTTLVSKFELADMQARIYLNLGVMEEHKSTDNNKAIKNYENAVKICKSNDLHELQHSALMALGYFYALKRNDTVLAMQTYNKALEAAKRTGIECKNDKMCETLLAKGTLLIKNGDFQSAKQTLKKAYKIRTESSDMEVIQKKFRIIRALCKYEDELITTDSYDYAKRKVFYEKLGDAACKLTNYEKAIDYYKKMLEVAELNGDADKTLIPIYVSLYQTYIDMKDYENALKYLHMEYELIKNSPSQGTCSTLLTIANMLHLMKKDFWEIDTAYRRALDESRLINDLTVERIILKKLVSVCKEYKMTSLAEIVVQDASERNIDLNTDDVEESQDIELNSEDIDINISSEISTDDAESSDDNDTILKKSPSSASTTVNISTSKGRRKRSLALKKNAKGETKLHEACINGNYQLAKMLIEQGHAINVRDNAGWIPLHEAANHGFRDIVELLLDNGAQSAINDRGGVNCDGISPLYDAAANGHLSVVQLLLDRGAKATIKTDSNEMPLDGLNRWYHEYSHALNSTEKQFYEDLKSRLVEQCEKVGIDISSKSHHSISLASSGYGSNQMKSKDNNNRRFNTNFSDDSDSNESEDNNIRRKHNASSVYRNAIDGLRNPHTRVGGNVGVGERRQDDNNFIDTSKKRSAYLSEKEIDPDDWLENDLGPIKKKPKTSTSKSHKVNDDDNNEEFLQSPVKSSNSIKSSINIIDFDDDAETENRIIVGEENALDAFDLMMLNDNSSKKSFKKSNQIQQRSRRNSKNSSNQSSLFDAGFSRFIEFADDTESSTSKKLISSPINSHNSSLNESLNRNNFALGMANEKQQMTIIKVQIDEEKIIVPINRDVANELKISWLIEESARRYYCLRGIRPELKLKTADGATLLESDTLDIILCLHEENLLYSEILDWKLPSLSNRYLEACSELKCGVDRDMNDYLDLNRAAITLDLSNQNLRPSTIRPILKALQHQNCLSQLNLSCNFIQDEGIKYLSQTLITLKHLTFLDLSGNAVTEVGLEHLCSVLTRSAYPQEIKSLKLNFNPIKSISLNNLIELCRCKVITSLSLVSCELMDISSSNMEKLNSLKELDISYNHLSFGGFREMLRKLNPMVIERINLERCMASTAAEEMSVVGETIVEFITSGCYTSLRELNLSGLKLNENEILNILRSLERCDSMRYLNLSYLKDLTFVSFKYLLFHMNNRNLNVNLIGCRNLQKISDMFSVNHNHNDISHYPCRVQLSLPKKSNIINSVSELNLRNEFIAKMRDIWNEITDTRGIVHIEGNSLKLFVENQE